MGNIENMIENFWVKICFEVIGHTTSAEKQNKTNPKTETETK